MKLLEFKKSVIISLSCIIVLFFAVNISEVRADFCGTDSYSCAGPTVPATIDWVDAPATLTNMNVPGGGPAGGNWETCTRQRYFVYINGALWANQVPSFYNFNAVNNATYNWRIRAQYRCSRPHEGVWLPPSFFKKAHAQPMETQLIYFDWFAGAGNTPNGVLIPRCDPPNVNIKANGSDGPISIDNNTSADLFWLTERANSCSASGDWSGAKPVSPVLDDPTSGMLSQSGMGGFNANNIVDNNVTTNGWNTDVSSVGSRLVIDLGAGNEKLYVVAALYATGAGYAGIYDIQYSDNGADWITTVSGFNPSSVGWNEIRWSGAGGPHRYWRFYLTNNPGGGPWLSELEMRRLAGEPTGNLIDTNSPYTYTLSCTGLGGTGNDSVTINVTSAPPPAPSVAISASPNPIDYNDSSTVTWSSTDADSCTVNPGGWTGTSGSQSTGNLISNTTYTADCTGPGGSDSDSVTVNVNAATLSVISLTANPAGGIQPVNNVDLGAVVGGTQTGTINYTFYCDRGDAGTNITPGWDAKFDNRVPTTWTAQNVCNYDTSGTYNAKVIVERGSLAAEKRTPITVTCNAGCSSWTACSAPCGGGSQTCTDNSSCQYNNSQACNTFACPTFGVNAEPSGLMATIVLGSSEPVDTIPLSAITVTPISGFNSNVTLSVDNPGVIPGATYYFRKVLTGATGSTCRLSDGQYSGLNGGCEFWITLPADTAGQPYDVRIHGNGTQLITTDAYATITVNVEIKDPEFIEL